MTREKQIEYFKGCLMATGREGVEDLLDFIEELGFYDAPASGGNHCCKDGGLLEHTVNVMQYAEKIGLTLLGSEAYNKIHRSYRNSVATAEYFQNRQILKVSQQKVMKEKSNLFTKLMGLFKKGEK